MERKMRDVYRLVPEKVEFGDLKKGDLFVMVGDDFEDGTHVTRALSDSAGNGPDDGIQCEAVGGLVRPLPDMLEA